MTFYVNPKLYRFHRVFVETSKEYYKDLFESSELKDCLLMNLIDYFTETFYKNFELDRFAKKRNASGTVIYSAYRNTKSQKLVYEERSGDGGMVLVKYNRRKLNELLNVICMLRNNWVKVEMLKTHIYFNYD